MKLIDSKTLLNLAKSYAGEMMAHARYSFVEYGARNEGYNAMADIIDKVVYNEFNHARMLYTYIQQASNKTIDNIDICSGYPFREKWDLTENLKLAAEDEAMEVKTYKAYEKTAREEGFIEIADLFNKIAGVETCHEKLFNDLYAQMSSGTLYKKEKAVVWKCSGCGYEQEGKEAWDCCPLCKAKQGFVQLHLGETV